MKRLLWILLVITASIGLLSCQKKAEQNISQQPSAQSPQTQTQEATAAAVSNEIEAIHTIDSRAFTHEEQPIPDFSSFPIKKIKNGEIQGRRFFNNELGFSFVVPEGVEIEWPKDKKVFFVIKVYVSEPEDLPGEAKEFEEIKKNIALQRFPNMPIMPSNIIEYLVKDNTNIAIEFYRGFDTYDGFIGKRLIFFRKNKLIEVYLEYQFPGPTLTQDGKILEKDKNNIQIILNNYYDKLKQENKLDKLDPYETFAYYLEKNFREGNMNEELPVEVQDLIKKFDYIIATLRFY